MRSLELGQKASASRVITNAEVEEYARLTGDRGSLHVDLSAGREPRSAVPAPLIGGMFSDLLGTELPGRGTNWMKQSFHFHEAAFTGDELTATVEIVRLRPEKDLVNLRTICTTSDQTLVCEGEALVMAREMA